MILAKVANIVLDESSNRQQLQSTLNQFSELCSEIGGITADPCFSAWPDDSLLNSGVAISPQAAAHCVQDHQRTVVYIRGIYAAIRDAMTRFPDNAISILYAGCGPYATLLLPLLELFEPGQLEVCLVDIHQDSLDSVSRLINDFGLSEHSIKLVQADACHYQHNSQPHLIITETMQKALEQEPQVAITTQLAPQLCHDGIFIPQKIEVDLVLHSRHQHHSLGNVLTLEPQCGPNFEEVQVSIPALAELDEFEAALITRVQVYEHYRLLEGESEITLPRPLVELSPLRAGQRWNIFFLTGSYPTFRLSTGNTNDQKNQPDKLHLMPQG